MTSKSILIGLVLIAVVSGTPEKQEEFEGFQSPDVFQDSNFRGLNEISSAHRRSLVDFLATINERAAFPFLPFVKVGPSTSSIPDDYPKPFTPNEQFKSKRQERFKSINKKRMKPADGKRPEDATKDTVEDTNEDMAEAKSKARFKGKPKAKPTAPSEEAPSQPVTTTDSTA